MRFLIAESDGYQREMIERTVRELGECFIVESGIEVLKAYVDSLNGVDSFDAVFISSSMPGMDGQQTLRRIREAEKDLGMGFSQEIPVILTEMLNSEQGIEAYLRGNYTSYIRKPLTEEKIMEEMTLLGLVS